MRFPRNNAIRIAIHRLRHILLHLLARMHSKLGDLNKAVQYADAAVKLNGHEPEYFATLGEVCQAAGLKDLAISALKKAVELRPNHEVFRSRLELLRNQ